MTICVNEHDMVYSGTDDRNSDIADMSDFSDDEDRGHGPDVIGTVQLKRH